MKLSATAKEAVANGQAEISQEARAQACVGAPRSLEHAKTTVLNSLTSSSGPRTYDHTIREFVAWYSSEPRLAFNRTVVLRYRFHLEQRGFAPATINLRLAGIRRIGYEAADAGLLSPVIADLVGKGGHVRTVPIPTWVQNHVDLWTAAAGVTHGPVFRAINKAGRAWGDGMSAKVPWDVVRAAAARAGIDRTCCRRIRWRLTLTVAGADAFVRPGRLLAGRR